MWITIVIAIIGAAGLIAVLADAPGRNEIRDLTFSDMDFKNLQDGTYVGEFKGIKSHLRDSKVELTVSKGIISNVKILKGALDKEGKPVKLKGGHSIEELLNNAVTKQTLEVDVISGATVTSKSHLKALENALEQAQPKK